MNNDFVNNLPPELRELARQMFGSPEDGTVLLDDATSAELVALITKELRCFQNHLTNLNLLIPAWIKTGEVEEYAKALIINAADEFGKCIRQMFSVEPGVEVVAIPSLECDPKKDTTDKLLKALDNIPLSSVLANMMSEVHEVEAGVKMLEVVVNYGVSKMAKMSPDNREKYRALVDSIAERLKFNSPQFPTVQTTPTV